MPKEHKKRGRREDEKKRKREHQEQDSGAKRHKKHVDDDNNEISNNVDEDAVENGQPAPAAAFEGAPHPGEMPFYGMLDEEEQEAFKGYDDLLERNEFETPEERTAFLENLYREADGKELKLANSQSCSRLMERLILLSTPEQLKVLFQKFSGNFLHLVQHRFASHCCEALFIQAAPIVTQELANPELVVPPTSDPDAVVVSMENLFLYTLAELEGYFGFLLTDRFASHVLRVLLVVLAGEPLARQSDRSLLQSKRKEKTSVGGKEKPQESALDKRPVPQAFTDALQKVINDTVAGLDTTYLRALAVHPTGNPTLQLLLKLELTKFGKSRAKDETSIIHRLLPDDPISEGTGSAAFINGMVYDPIGSRLLESVLENAPGKFFKAMYREFFKSRMGSLSRNEIASYIAAKILERLSAEDLKSATSQIVEQIPGLVERGRTAIIRTLIERCAARGVSVTPIKVQLEAAYSGPNGFEVTRILRLVEAPSDDGKPETRTTQAHPEKVHGSLLAQAMMQVPGPLGDLIFDSLAKLGEHLAIKVARDPSSSRTLQAALLSDNASVIFRRKMILQLYGHIGELALDPAGSHVIDAIWKGTAGLAFIRSRIAEELAENEAALRESWVGRAVWRNWKMDMFKRKRGEWETMSKWNVGNDGFQPFPEENGDSTSTPRETKHQAAITKARQKWVAAKAEQAKKEAKRQKQEAKRERAESTSPQPESKKRKSKHATGANAIGTKSSSSKDKGKAPVLLAQ